MENLRLEDLWKQKFKKKAWLDEAVQRFLSSLAPATWLSYNRYFNRFMEFCWLKGVTVRPEIRNQCVGQQSEVVEFLVDVSSSSRRPKAVLNSSVAALQNYYRAMDEKSPIDNDVWRLVDGLVKSGTSELLRRSLVLPVQPFITLFRKWGQNSDLSVWSLRLKSLTLLALTAMLRPSDVAPRSEKWDDSMLHSNVFKRSWLDFLSNKYLQIYLFGIKNDYNCDGFCINVPFAKEKVVCPVLALKEYVRRTDKVVKADGAVFVSLNKPYELLSASGIASALNKAIELVGLHNKGYSAKCFRPTGVTTAVECGVSASFVQALGRWKSTETFQKHYVHAKPPMDFTDQVLNY